MTSSIIGMKPEHLADAVIETRHCISALVKLRHWKTSIFVLTVVSLWRLWGHQAREKRH